jgi:nitrile hydratase
MPPTWYKSRTYRSRVVHEPRAVLEEFGTKIPSNKEVKVHDSNADMRYLILPQRPKGTEGWNEKELTQLISRDHLVGVRIPEDVI